MSGTQFYISVLAPCAVLIVPHFIMFVPIFKNMSLSDSLLANNFEIRKKENTKRAKATFVVNLLFALLWMVALLHGVFQLKLLRFAYCALIPVLGLVVCVAHIRRSNEAKKAWGKIFFCCKTEEESSEPELVKLRQHNSLLDSEEKDAKRGSLIIYLFRSDTS